VQAATGSEHHISIQALLTLQEQLQIRETTSQLETSFNQRLSRIVFKLFSKVIKAEEALESPYSGSKFDLEAVFCAVEDILETMSTNLRDSNDTNSNCDSCREMVMSLMKSISQFRSLNELEDIVEGLEIGGHSSAIWSMLVTINPEKLNKRLEGIESPQLKPTTPSTKVSNDVVDLVAAIGSAPEGSDRISAIHELRVYREHHGDHEIKAHLGQLSHAFRDYIWEQLNTSPETPTKKIDTNDDNLSMSERIKKLRSRLNAAESSTASLDSTTQLENKSPEIAKSASPPKTNFSASSATSPKTDTPSRIATPSRIPKPSTPVSKHRSSSNVLSLRQRLAAAQANQLQAEDSAHCSDSPSVSYSGHAAALRARLQAAKNQTGK